MTRSIDAQAQLFQSMEIISIKEGQGHSKYIADVVIDGVLYKGVKFGDKRYQHYKDRTYLKLYSHLDHGDKERLRLFHLRHKKNNGPSALLSKRFLW